MTKLSPISDEERRILVDMVEKYRQAKIRTWLHLVTFGGSSLVSLDGTDNLSIEDVPISEAFWNGLESKGFVSLGWSNTGRTRHICIEQNAVSFIENPDEWEKSSVSAQSFQFYGNVVNTGVMNIGLVEHVVNQLQATEKQPLAEALENLSEAISQAENLSDDEKSDANEVVAHLGQEITKPQPNKMLVRRLYDGLVGLSKDVPTLVNAALAVQNALRMFGLF